MSRVRAVIIPIEFDSTIKISYPVLGKFIFYFDALDQMICIFLTHIFYPKIVHNQCEQDGACGEFPQTFGTFEISMWEKTVPRQFIC